MEVLKEKNEKQDVIELVKEDKHLKMTKSKYDELSVSFSYDEDKKGLWFQEFFEVGKNDGEVYNIVNGTFLSYGGDVFFDSYGSNVVLFNEDGNYKFFFMKESYEASKEITCKLFPYSMENNSLNTMFERLDGIAKTIDNKEKPKTLSKTLKK